MLKPHGKKRKKKGLERGVEKIKKADFGHFFENFYRRKQVQSPTGASDHYFLLLKIHKNFVKICFSSVAEKKRSFFIIWRNGDYRNN
jgi:hypothetical protein